MIAKREASRTDDNDDDDNDGDVADDVMIRTVMSRRRMIKTMAIMLILFRVTTEA